MVSMEQVEAAQHAWGSGIVAIASSHAEGGDYVAVARNHVKTLYAYGRMPVLFKPTMAPWSSFGRPLNPLFRTLWPQTTPAPKTRGSPSKGGPTFGSKTAT